MPTKPVDPQSTNAGPIEYASKWIAWNSDHWQIVAHSESMKELWRVVRERGIPDPVFEKVPRSNVRFVGTR